MSVISDDELPFDELAPVECPSCKGRGRGMVEVLQGYVSRDMASDAGEPQLEGEAVFGEVEQVCDFCGGRGRVEARQLEDHPGADIGDDDLPF